MGFMALPGRSGPAEGGNSRESAFSPLCFSVLLYHTLSLIPIYVGGMVARTHMTGRGCTY